MADNTQLSTNIGVGDVAASDDIAGVKYQRVKPAIGADGTATDAVPVSNGMDVTGAAVQAVGIVGQFDDTAPGAVTENQFAPVRISTRRALLVEGVASGTAQPISAASLPLPTDAATETTLAAANTSLAILDDWDETDRAKVNVIVGQAGIAAGAGVVGVTVPRVTLASDDPAVASLSVLDDWDNAASDGASVSGDVAHDAADAGEPLKMGGRADTTFQAAVADGDRVNALFDVYGVQNVRDDHPNKWSYHENSSSALTDASVQAAPGAGLSVYITDIMLSNGAATALNLFIEEGASTVLGPYYLEAVVGRSLHVRFKTPKKGTANTAITVTTSAAIAHGLDILGFIAP